MTTTWEFIPADGDSEGGEREKEKRERERMTEKKNMERGWDRRGGRGTGERAYGYAEREKVGET